MKKLIVFLFVAAITLNAFAADENDAALLVKKYSETIACQLGGISDFQKNQYKAVTVKPGLANLDGFGAVFVVYWEGDVGCYGGNNSIVPNFTVVEHTGFASAAPVVKPDYEFPYLPLVKLTSISGKNGQLAIEGVIYGPNDRHHLPTKVVSYTLKLVDNEFVKQ